MATLVYSDVDGVDRSFALGHEPVTVGRDPQCTIRSNDPRVSRHHARFYVDQGALWVEDLGSSNGIFVGPNKVQRAPVPTGEIILIGSLMIRLLPASGTLPPPMGLHGTLATWLDLERKTRAGVEEERDAFAKRVGELHQQIAAMKHASDTLRPENTAPIDGEAVRLHAEAEAKIAVLERALEGMHAEVESLRGLRAGEDVATPIPGELEDLRDRVAMLEKERAEWSSGGKTADADLDLEAEVARLRAALENAESAKSIVEHAHAEASREAQELRDQLLVVKRQSTAEIDAAKLEAAKAREKGMVAETSAGMAAAEKL
ncbi:MAG: FHA domain-containing protein, partial [Kofleriaceae bacterium]